MKTESALDLGMDHWLEWVAHKEDRRTGVEIHHKTPKGAECVGWVPFKGGAWDREFKPSGLPEAWTVVSLDPLTLSPSIRCTACGDHGHIVNGKWSLTPP